MFAKLFQMMDGKNREHTSETDQFLKQLTKTFPKYSASQRKEIDKHRNIFARTTDNRIQW